MEKDDEPRFIDALRGLVGVAGPWSSWLSVPEALLLDRRPRGRVRDRVTVLVDVAEDLRRGTEAGASLQGVSSPMDCCKSLASCCKVSDPILAVWAERVMLSGEEAIFEVLVDAT